MKSSHFILVILSVFFSISPVFGQEIIPSNESFYHISMPGGLEQNSISQILQDQDGQMWFATKDGLVRYNGKKIFVYKNDPDNTNTIGHNFVNRLLIDKNGILWVGTQKGLSVYRVETDDFEMFHPEIFANEDIRSLKMDTKGNIWILNAIKNQLYNYNPITKKLSVINADDLTDNRGSIQLEWLVITNEDRLFLINKNKGMLEYFPKTKTCKLYNFNDRDIYYALFIQDKRNKDLFWITTHEGYFFSYNLITHQQKKYYINRKLTNYGLRCYQSGIFEDDDNNIWITTWFYGTFKMLKDRKTILQYLPNRNDNNAISNSITTAPYQDTAGYMWFGAEYNGVDILKKNKKFFVIPDINNKENTLPAKGYLSATKDKQNRVWLGAEGGLYSFDKKTLETKDLSKGFLKDAGRFFKIYHDSKNNLWFGTEKGLYKYNLEDKNIQHFTQKDDDYNTIICNHIRELYEDKEGNIWIGYFHKGVSKYNPETKKFFHFTPDKENPHSISFKYVSCIYATADNTLWVGTLEGLNRFNKDAGNFNVYKNDKRDLNSIGSSVINSITELDGVLWIATQGGGLNRYDSKKKSFQKYTKQDGLPSNNIKALLVDTHHNLWFSTTKNIVKYNPKNEHFTVYTESDGLENHIYIDNMGWQDLEFSENFAHKDAEGFLYFGGSSGLVIFHPDSLPQNNYKANLVIESIKTNGKSIEVSDNKISLQPNENQLEVNFTLLNVIQPEKNKYTWKLDPYDTTWSQIGKNSKAAYFNLKHGEYKLFYKATNNDGVWSKKTSPLVISVLPHFYQTKLFLVLNLLLIGIIISGFLLYRWYLKQKLKKQKKLLRYKTSSLDEDRAKRINQKLIEFLNKEPVYLESDLSLYSLAEKIQVKPHYLSQVINQYHGKNFQDYMNTYRVLNAKEMLLKTQLKIEAIAYDCGFNSISTFYSAFKKETGITPAAYRKNNNLSST